MSTCPVCLYGKLTHPPRDYTICPCCGTEFEADDFDFTHAELRERWVASGASWFSSAILPPEGWDPFVQLGSIPQIAITG